MIAMRMSSRRLAVTAFAMVSLAATGLLATACSAAGAPATTKTVTATPPPSTTTVTVTPTATPSGPGLCLTSNLRLAVGRSDGAAGTNYYPLDFTNTSSAACTMYGYPGVSFVATPGGSIIGAPAGRRTIGGTGPALITLQPGATAHATLAISDVLVGDQCRSHQVSVRTIQAFPPDQYTALSAPFTGTGCADKSLVVMWVSPVATGS